MKIRKYSIYYLFIAMILVFLALSTLLHNSTLMIANDELKFAEIAKNTINYSDQKIERTTRDFLGYYFIGKIVSDIDSSIVDYYFYKILSFVAFTLSIYYLRKFRYPFQVVFLVSVHPMLLYYGTVGVRDSISSFIIIYFSYLLYANKSYFSLYLTIVLSFFIRPELVVILITIQVLFYADNRALLVYAFLVVVGLLFREELVEGINRLFYLKSLGNASTTGFLATLRSLPFPLDLLGLGTVGLSGTFISSSTVALQAINEFRGIGVYFSNPDFVPYKLLKVIGIVVSNILFPSLVYFLFKEVMAGKLLDSTADKKGRLFVVSSLLLFCQSWISIETGKASSFYLLIYPYVIWKLMASNRKSILISIGILFSLIYNFGALSR